jgi:hypothetical protein
VSRPPRGLFAYALLFLALFVPFSYFNHNDGWNQGVRIAQLHAVVVKHTIRIDAYQDLTGDKAFINGHYYSEKAPAMVVAALPAFALTVWIQQALGIDPDSEPASRVSGWIATAGSVGLLAAVGGVAFFALLVERVEELITRDQAGREERFAEAFARRARAQLAQHLADLIFRNRQVFADPADLASRG